MERLYLPFASPEGEGFCPRKWTMTKRHPLAGRVERDGVADLDLAVGDQHAVDQQLDQLPLPREVGAGQARANPPAEVRGRGRPAGELGPPVHLRLELIGLPAQRM